MLNAVMLSETYYILAAGSVIVGAVWWLSAQFSFLRNMIYTKAEELRLQLTSKFEYHEKHDDERFGNISNDLWAIRMRNAARDGVMPIPTKEIAKRD